MGLIKGIHHVSMKCCNAQEYEETIKFYRDILGIPVIRTWDTGIMFDTGCGLVEVFNNADIQLEKGTVRHFAFASDSVDDCVKAVKDAGYEVFMGPTNIVIEANPAYPARIAFCNGPLGEEIEFFEENHAKDMP